MIPSWEIRNFFCIFQDLVEAYRTTAYDNLEVVRCEDENACKEHELIFGDKDSSILPSPTLPTQFCGRYQGYFQ